MAGAGCVIGRGKGSEVERSQRAARYTVEVILTRAASAVCFRIPGMVQKPHVKRRSEPTALLASQVATCHRSGLSDSGEQKETMT